MEEHHKEQAIGIIKNILHAIHEKRYGDIITYVDETETKDIDELFEFVQGTLELNDFDAIDEYGVPCNFHPEYEYSQLNFYEYNNLSGFEVEYAMTSDSELIDMVLQLKFLYTDDVDRIKSTFITVDPQ